MDLISDFSTTVFSVIPGLSARPDRSHRLKVIHSTLHQYRLYSTCLLLGRWHLRTRIPILILQLSFEVPIALHTAVVRFADTQYYLRTSDRLFLVQELTSWLAITFLRHNVYLK